MCKLNMDTTLVYSLFYTMGYEEPPLLSNLLIFHFENPSIANKNLGGGQWQL